MIYSSKKDGSKRNSIILMIFVCFLLSNISVFGQTAIENNQDQTTSIELKDIANSNIEMNSINQEAKSDTSNMNFILWFMGSKQSPNATVLPVGTSAKRQFMTSGTEPNRLLIKAFLKKAVNFESSMV